MMKQVITQKEDEVRYMTTFGKHGLPDQTWINKDDLLKYMKHLEQHYFFKYKMLKSKIKDCYYRDPRD